MFNYSGLGSNTQVGTIKIWRRGNKIVQIQIPRQNLSQFICTEVASDSRTNIETYLNPVFIIPACPAVTALIPIGGNVRGFEFKNFKLDVAPSNYFNPVPSVTLNGINLAKGL